MKTTETYFPKETELKPRWHLIDAEGQHLGRLASRIAILLQGKDKVSYTPNLLCGDFVVVVNAEKVKVTGKKAEQKTYLRYSGYHGGLKEIPFSTMTEKNPARVIELAVRGMLPKNRLAARMLRRLKVYAGPEHPHKAQLSEKGD